MTDKELFEKGLLAICQDLHMYMNDRTEGLTQDDVHVMVEYLHRRMAAWRQPSSTYDNAVFYLCDQALREYAK